MKLRLKGNSVRVRLDRRDLEGLIDRGRIDDSVRFAPGLAFSYAVEMGPAARERPKASYTDGRLTIRIDPDDAEEWLAGDRVGFDHDQVVDGWRRARAPGEGLRLHRPARRRGGRRRLRVPQPDVRLLDSRHRPQQHRDRET